MAGMGKFFIRQLLAHSCQTILLLRGPTADAREGQWLAIPDAKKQGGNILAVHLTCWFLSESA